MNPSQVFYRAVPARLEVSEPQPDGHRRLSGRLVPYGVAADVMDHIPGQPRPDFYREGFRAGAFEPQVRIGTKVAKIGLVHTHDGGGLGYLGPFVQLREEPDGLYGVARILPTKVEDLGALIEEGINELSIEFRLRGSLNTVETDGVRWRTAVHLDRVALEAKGAYSGAEVLAYRQEVDEEQREAAAAEAKQAQEAAEREAGEAAAEEERKRAEAEEAQRADRRRAWDELAGRLDGEKAKQADLVRTYGVTQPGGYRRI